MTICILWCYRMQRFITFVHAVCLSNNLMYIGEIRCGRLTVKEIWQDECYFWFLQTYVCMHARVNTQTCAHTKWHFKGKLAIYIASIFMKINQTQNYEKLSAILSKQLFLNFIIPWIPLFQKSVNNVPHNFCEVFPFDPSRRPFHWLITLQLNLYIIFLFFL
jgi:hypothetical protein